MGLRACAVGALAAALTATVAIGGAASASAAEPATIIDACVEGPRNTAMVYLVPVGVTVRFDTSECYFTRQWTESNPSDETSVTRGAYYDVTLTTAASWVDVATPTPDLLVYPCGVSTANGSRLDGWNLSGAEATYWDPRFAAAVDLCSLGSSGSAEPPASWHLSYARTTDAACEAGWSASWAAWPNNGNGGPVCNREIFFDVAASTWSSR